MIYYIILTALTVSIDSFVCGFSLSFSQKKPFLVVPIIAATVFLMCLATNYLAELFSDKLSEKAGAIGGLILAAVGVFNFVRALTKKDNGDLSATIKSGKGFVADAFLSGFAVGIDGAIANLSLALMGQNAIYVPAIIAVMHAVMIGLGVFLSGVLNKTAFFKKRKAAEIIPPLILIVLGSYKIMSALI